MNHHWDALVIGGGYSGLLAAWEHTQAGRSVAVLEKNSQCGGALSPLGIDTLTIDAGAEAFSTAGDSVLRLLDELDLRSQCVNPARSDARIISSDGMSYPIPHGVMGIPSNLGDPELENIFSPEILNHARILDSAEVPETTGWSVEELVVNRLGQEFVDTLVTPVLSGVHGSSAQHLDAWATLPQLMTEFHATGSLTQAAFNIRATSQRPGSAVAGLAGGIWQLSERILAILEDSGAHIFTNADVSQLSCDNQIMHAHSVAGEFSARHVTIATELPHAHTLLSQLGLPPMEGTEDSTVSVALATLHVTSGQLDSAPLGSGALVTEGAPIRAKATTHVSAKWGWVQQQLPPHRHLVRLSYGRGEELSNEDISQFAVEDFIALYGVTDATIHEVSIVHWENSLFRASTSSAAQIAIMKTFAAEQGIELRGSYVSGNGLLGITRDYYQRKNK